jgi:hypothetical protein
MHPAAEATTAAKTTSSVSRRSGIRDLLAPLDGPGCGVLRAQAGTVAGAALSGAPHAARTCATAASSHSSPSPGASRGTVRPPASRKGSTRTASAQSTYSSQCAVGVTARSWALTSGKRTRDQGLLHVVRPPEALADLDGGHQLARDARVTGVVVRPRRLLDPGEALAGERRAAPERLGHRERLVVVRHEQDALGNRLRLLPLLGVCRSNTDTVR